MSRGIIVLSIIRRSLLLKLTPNCQNNLKFRTKTSLGKSDLLKHAYSTCPKRNYCSIDDCSNNKKSQSYNRDNYDEKIESLINHQINVELCAGYTYLNMASYFGRSNVALPGCYGFFMKMYYEEQTHAFGFIRYQNMRGGHVCLTSIIALEQTEWCDVAACFRCALDMEKNVKGKLVNVFRTAEKLGDSNVLDMLDPLIDQQEQSICEISRLVTRSSELTPTNVGRYLFDRELHETHVKSDATKCIMDLGNKLYT